MQRTLTGDWLCLECGLINKIKQRVIQHIESKHLDIGTICEICKKCCSTRNALRAHKYRHHNLLSFANDNCYFCACFGTYAVKINFYSGQTSFEAEMEKKMYPLALVGSGTSGYGCTDCDYTARDRHAMSLHVEAKHVTGYSLNCPVCGRVCPTREALRKHLSRNHNS